MLLRKETPAQWFFAAIALLAPWSVFVLFRHEYGYLQMFAAVVMVIAPIAIALRSRELLLRTSRSDVHQLIRVTPLAQGLLVREYARKQLYLLRFELAVALGFAPVFWTSVGFVGDYPLLGFVGVTFIAATLNVVPALVGVTYLIKRTGTDGARRAITLVTVVAVALTVLLGAMIVAGITLLGPCGHPYIEFGPVLFYCF